MAERHDFPQVFSHFAGRLGPRGAAALLLALAVLLLLPGLGGFGLWQPAEFRVARQAASLARGTDAGTDLVLPAQAFAPALGLRLFGMSEAAARLPGALLALATLAAVGLAGATLFNRRTGWLAALVLAGFPLFTLEARQLTSDVPVWLGVALALAGFAKAGWTPARVALIAAGLGLATFFGGAMVGLLPLLATFALATALAGARDRQSRWPAALAGVGALVLGAALLLSRHVAGQASLLLGGRPTAGTAFPFSQLVEVLGFGLFPLGALGLLSFYLVLARNDGDARGGATDLAPLLLLFTAALGLGLSVAQLHLLGQARLPFVPAVALAIAATLDRAGDTDALAGRTLALLAGAGSFLVARDLSLAPEALLSVHLPAGQTITWPPALPLSVKTLVLVVGIATALGLGLLLALPAGDRLRPLSRAALPLVLGPALLMAFALAHGVVPALSPYLSSKAVLDAFRRLAPPGAPLGLHRVDGDQLGVFERKSTLELPSESLLIEHLKAAPTAFALIPREALISLDIALTAARIPYAVADASSARHLLLTGVLPPGAVDRNPLREHVWHSNADGPRPAWADPGALTTPPRATFGDAITLLGADFPREVRRGRDLPLTLFFGVLAPPPAGQHIFVHLELPGEPLVNGDHAPLAGAFATQHWRPGDIIRDQHAVELPRVTTAPGAYRLLVGFWPGGNTTVRLPITAGQNDGLHRVALGTVHIR